MSILDFVCRYLSKVRHRDSGCSGNMSAAVKKKKKKKVEIAFNKKRFSAPISFHQPPSPVPKLPYTLTIVTIVVCKANLNRCAVACPGPGGKAVQLWEFRQEYSLSQTWRSCLGALYLDGVAEIREWDDPGAKIRDAVG